jgi:hypothetical protein
MKHGVPGCCFEDVVERESAVPDEIGTVTPTGGFIGKPFVYQRGSRIPRPSDPLAFWRRYSA